MGGMCSLLFFVSSRRRHTRCALVTGVQTCALPILLDVQGLLAAAGVDASEAGRSREEAAEVEAAAARSATQLLLFRDTNQRVRGVRLSVIERVEQVPALALSESAGEIQAKIGGAIFPVHDATLHDGHETGQAHVTTPVTNAPLVCCLLLAK